MDKLSHQEEQVLKTVQSDIHSGHLVYPTDYDASILASLIKKGLVHLFNQDGVEYVRLHSKEG